MHDGILRVARREQNLDIRQDISRASREFAGADRPGITTSVNNTSAATPLSRMAIARSEFSARKDGVAQFGKHVRDWSRAAPALKGGQLSGQSGTALYRGNGTLQARGRLRIFPHVSGKQIELAPIICNRLLNRVLPHP